jgi:hypothetical protein
MKLVRVVVQVVGQQEALPIKALEILLRELLHKGTTVVTHHKAVILVVVAVAQARLEETIL